MGLLGGRVGVFCFRGVRILLPCAGERAKGSEKRTQESAVGPALVRLGPSLLAVFCVRLRVASAAVQRNRHCGFEIWIHTRISFARGPRGAYRPGCTW